MNVTAGLLGVARSSDGCCFDRRSITSKFDHGADRRLSHSCLVEFVRAAGEMEERALVYKPCIDN